MKKRYITFDYKKEESASEIDFDLYADLKHDNCKEELNVIRKENKNNYWANDSYPIKIERLIKMLENLKKAGCNYVEIMYHTDHIGYYATGLKIRNATKEEIEKYEAETKRNKKKWEKIQKLREQIKEIENEE